MRASEWTQAGVTHVALTIGAPARIRDVDLIWWQMSVDDAAGRRFDVQALSERAPMTTPAGDIGAVFRYVFRQRDCPALEYVNRQTGLAHLPRFGFRDGLIPTPRSVHGARGPFLGTGNYLGQALAVADSGTGGEWLDLGPVTVLTLDDDLLIGTARMFRDDGTGQDESREYRYTELTPADYEEMIDAGFNLFGVNEKHADYVRERPVFFVKGAFGQADPYPEMLYRSNYWGPCMFTDEPAIRLDTSDCATVHDAANLLRLRNYAYHRMPGSMKLDPRLTQPNAVINLIQQQGFNVGDWLPLQTHVGVWETIHESAFYQMQGGAAFIVHEGRYALDPFNGTLEHILGPGARCSVKEMFDLTYCFMRGAARCFGNDWGTAIYGQADYSIAPDAVRQAYAQGARFIWWWTSDHDHHLPFARQLELTRIVRAHQLANPRAGRIPQIRAARVAVAIPDGYVIGGGPNMWGNANFRFDKLNELGVAYGDINSEAWWHLYRLVKQGLHVDCIVDVPSVVDAAGYDSIVRIGADGRASLPAPKMPAEAPALTAARTGAAEQYAPRPGAPGATAAPVRPGAIEIDANLADWADARWIDLDEKQMYEAAGETWGGERDLSAQAAFAYDEDAVYIAVRVKDDTMTADHRGDLIWQNDSVQVAFDPFFNPHPEGAYALDDIEIGFSLADGVPYAHRWDYRPVGAPGEVKGARVAISRDGNVTVYEARVPFESLWPLSPAFPGRCGMTVVVNDADGGLRRGAIGWTRGLADVKNPSLFGVLEFEGADGISNLPPVAFAQAERTVVRRGEQVVLRLDTGSRDATQMDLEVVVRHHDVRAPRSRMSGVKVPAGMNRFELRLDTSGLESDSYRADLTLRSGDRTAAAQSFRFYVLP